MKRTLLDSRRKAQAVTAPVPPELEDESSEVEDDAYQEIARIKDELGDEEAKVVLQRRGEHGLLRHVGVMSASDFDIERVIKDYGGGRYRAAYYKGKEKLGSTMFDIDPSIPSRLPGTVPVPEREEAVVPSASGIGDPVIRALEATMSRQADLLNQLIVQMATAPKGNHDQGNGTQQQAIELALKMVEIINSRSPVSERPAYADVVEMVKMGMELRKGADSEDNSYWPVIERFAEPVAKVLNNALERERGAPTPGRGSRVHAPATLPPAQPDNGGEPPVMATSVPEGPPWFVHLKPFLPTLMGWAKAGKDPALYAEVLIDNLPPGAEMELEAATRDPQFVDKALAALPMFRPYSAWATRMLENIKLSFEPDPEEEKEPEDESGGAAGGDG